MAARHGRGSLGLWSGCESFSRNFADLEFRLAGVRSADNAHEYAAIEPVQRARLATADDRASATEVEMHIQQPVTSGAVEAAVKISGIGRRGNHHSGDRNTQLLDEIFNEAHLNQHAAALLARTQLHAGQGCIP